MTITERIDNALGPLCAMAYLLGFILIAVGILLMLPAVFGLGIVLFIGGIGGGVILALWDSRDA